MPQLLLELFSEEIPARMQKRAEEDLAKLLSEKLKAAGLAPSAMKTFSGPRRLGLVIEDLPAKAADVSEEKKGPRVGSPDQAIQGFLKIAGLASIDEAQIVEDKKGAFYVAKIERQGRPTPEIVQQAIPEIVRAFPWPKSMRSGVSDLQWVRPLHNICCVFAGKAVAIEIEGVGAEAKTWGHRFHAPAGIKPKDFADYAEKLREAHVLIDREERKAIIIEQARARCAERKLELVEDAGLLEEVAGLVEWPVVLLGDMDGAFLDLPGEVIRLSMRTHQKYFAVRDPKTKKLAPHFVVVANVEATDGGKTIAAGNARVLSARLNDARFFWETDKKTPLRTQEREDKLKKLVFHAKLGSVWDKVERVRALAAELCTVTGADVDLVNQAALLSKMDLVTETVGEFPELQGQVGKELYLEMLGEAADPSIAAAIEDHYRPLGPNDRVPTDPVAITLALADKLDTLVGFWAIDEKPTGSSDPFALRRAALGIVRIVTSSGMRLGVRKNLQLAAEINFKNTRLDWMGELELLKSTPMMDTELRQLDEVKLNGVYGYLIRTDGRFPHYRELTRRYLDGDTAVWEQLTPLYKTAPHVAERFSIWSLNLRERDERPELPDSAWPALGRARRTIDRMLAPLRDDLLAFLADRLKVQLRDQGKRHDLVDAVFALGDDDLVRIVARVEALDAFLKTEDGKNLLAGYKRAANIIAAEEKKGKWSAADADAELDASKLVEPAEKALHAALETALPQARAAVEKEDFAAAMKALAGLRAPVDAFFEAVLVNADDPLLRRNRLLLLSRLVEALSQVADFSEIEG
jgi:glycyl-tRNA synthetase beta chain